MELKKSGTERGLYMMMNLIEKGTFEGERPLFKIANVQIKHSEFLVGESAVKESRNLKVSDCSFSGKYPF
ncbi:hypothetical protein Back11_15680 [Paenibacillus baekrokdamisoli]|uniref:Uncharacterized protein n=1 Tax=Paenibacillus baekrokdamisoli TaxID=1712516 RepID=A0A3G9J5Y9_9BACL|nr:hypothetical protein [Paenibacillus baekrokdamisoli]BBH20223.1 hypothetical protein Back11_15680 [Paenibacillus baekrokdamisoli]